MFLRIAEIDDQPKQQPADHHFPGNRRQLRHQVNRGDDAQDRNQRNEGRLEGPLQVWMPHSQYPYARTDNREGQQRADVDQVRQTIDGQEGRHDRRE